jgi:hypothetical protein
VLVAATVRKRSEHLLDSVLGLLNIALGDHVGDDILAVVDVANLWVLDGVIELKDLLLDGPAELHVLVFMRLDLLDLLPEK